MRYSFFAILFFFVPKSYSQIGFNQSYDVGEISAGFQSIVLSNDTLVVYGLALQPGAPAFGLMVAKFDTLGNFINHYIYNDTLGDNFTILSQNSFIKLADNSGYMGVGQFDVREGFWARFDNDGNLVQIVEHNDSIYRDYNFREIIEVEDGFIIVGDNFSFSTQSQGVVLKIDKSGELKWEKRFGLSNREDFFGSILIINNNEFVIGAVTTSQAGTPTPQIKSTSKIIAIDSLGNLKWQWESPLSLDELGVGKLARTPDENWIYSTLRGWYNPTYNEISVQPKLVIRDQDFNIIREDTFGIADVPSSNNIINLKQMSSGGWLAIGVKPVKYPLEPLTWQYNAEVGWMLRLDTEGDQVWSRIDTAFWSTESGSYNYYFDAVELPSGSIIACGYSRTYDPVLKDWGWLVKVSKDGCIDTLACMPVGTHQPAKQMQNVTVSPNPAHDYADFAFSLPQHGQMVSLHIFDITGRLVLFQNGLSPTGTYTWETGNCTSGVYFYHVSTNGFVRHSGKIVLAKP